MYVVDAYEGLQARRMVDCTDAELEAYIDANVGAVRDVVAAVAPDVALANHLLLGPVILARALASSGVPYAVKLHGSALEYVLKVDPARFTAPALEGSRPRSPC